MRRRVLLDEPRWLGLGLPTHLTRKRDAKGKIREKKCFQNPDGGIWVGLYSVHSLNTADKKSEAKNVSLVSNMQQTFVAFFGFTLVSRFKQRKGML